MLNFDIADFGGILVPIGCERKRGKNSRQK